MSKSFNEAVAKVVVALKGLSKGKEISIVHHDDADGLCSVATTKRALEREGFSTNTICIEKVYPEVIRSIHANADQVIFYCDIGSSHADLISDYNEGKNLTVILDHHDPAQSKDPKVIDLNLENYGFRGETDFSGATCCYLFAKRLNEANTDLSYLGLTGSFEIPSEPQKLNKTVLKEAIDAGVLKVKGKNFLINRLGMTTRQLFSHLQILGAVGYYQGGPEMGIELALNGMNDRIKAMVSDLKEKRKTANKKLLYILYRKRLRQSEHVQWFTDEGLYAGMGTKTIGTFCSMLSYRGQLINPMKYLVGFMDVPREIPGYGSLSKEYAKVSVRVPRPMQKLIDSRKLLSAVDLLKRASEGFGIADGHAYAASAVIEKDKVDRFITNLEPTITADVRRQY